MVMESTSIKMDSNMKDNGSQICQMAEDKPIIQIKVDIMEIFSITKDMEREYWWRKDAFFRDNLSAISFKAMEGCRIAMDKHMKDNGRWMRNMERVNMSGQMAINISDNTCKARDMDLEPCIISMARFIKETGQMVKNMVQVTIKPKKSL